MAAARASPIRVDEGALLDRLGPDAMRFDLTGATTPDKAQGQRPWPVRDDSVRMGHSFSMKALPPSSRPLAEVGEGATVAGHGTWPMRGVLRRRPEPPASRTLFGYGTARLGHSPTSALTGKVRRVGNWNGRMSGDVRSDRWSCGG